MQNLRQSLKFLLCEGLHLQDVRPDEIDDGQSLFGEGLGLDSVDALELAIEIEKRLSVKTTQSDEDRAAFVSIRARANYLTVRGVTYFPVSLPKSEPSLSVGRVVEGLNP